MKKINFFLSLLFLISLPLASCGDDKNDPIQDENGSGNGTSGVGEDYSFMVNNNPFYYGMRHDERQDFRHLGYLVDHGSFYNFYLDAYPEQREYWVDYGSSYSHFLSLFLQFRPFNLSTVKKGDKIDINNIDINQLVYEGNTYYLNYNSESDVTIVSYKNYILTINLNNLQFKIGSFKYPGSPDVLTLSGDIACEVELH